MTFTPESLTCTSPPSFANSPLTPRFHAPIPRPARLLPHTLTPRTGPVSDLPATAKPPSPPSPSPSLPLPSPRACAFFLFPRLLSPLLPIPFLFRLPSMLFDRTDERRAALRACLRACLLLVLLLRLLLLLLLVLPWLALLARPSGLRLRLVLLEAGPGRARVAFCGRSQTEGAKRSEGEKRVCRAAQ